MPIIPGVQEKKVEVRYRYKGVNFRDPFISLTESKVFSSAVTATGEGQLPNFGTLNLKGILRDKEIKIALLSSPNGRYLLKNDKLYDNMNRLVRGVKGTIGEKKVKLVTHDNFVCELKFNKTQK